MPYDAMEDERLLFLCELYIRSAGDTRQGVPYEELIDALGFSEAVMKRIQQALQEEGLVELTTVPPMTHMSRPVMDRTHRLSRHQTIAITPQGVRLMEDIFAKLNTAPGQPSASRDQHATSMRNPGQTP